MSETYQGARPRISGLFRDLPPAPPGWEEIYSQSQSRSLRLATEGAVPEGCEATMEVYSGPQSARETVTFPAGTRLALVGRGGPRDPARVIVYPQR